MVMIRKAFNPLSIANSKNSRKRTFVNGILIFSFAHLFGVHDVIGDTQFEISSETECNYDCDVDIYEDDVEYLPGPQLTNSSDISNLSGSWSELYGDNTKTTLRYEVSYLDSVDSTGMETNRASARYEWDKLFLNNIYVKFDGKVNSFFAQDRRSRFDDKELTFDFPIREFYLQASSHKYSAALGRQIVIWGESDIATVVDIISPRNISDFYFTSLDESRIGQDIARLDYYSTFGHWSYYYIHDPKINEDPILHSDYDINGTDIGNFDIQNTLDDLDPEHGIRWKKSIGLGDFSIMAADVASNEPFYVIQSSATAADERTVQFPRYKMIGGATNLVSGDTSVNIEFAHKMKLPFQSLENVTGITTRDTNEAAIAINYNISNVTGIYAGLSNQHILGDITEIENGYKDTNDLAFGIATSFLHETLSVSYDYQYQFQDKNIMHNASVSYLTINNLSVSLGVFKLVADDKEVFSYFQQDSLMLTIEKSY